MNSLDDKLHYIGIRLAGNFHHKKKDWIDLEETLVEACYEVPNDSRILSLLLSWVKVHGNYIITEKLIKTYKKVSIEKGPSPWLNALLAFAAEECSYKFAKWVRKEKEKVFFGDQERAESLIVLKGAVPFLEKINIFVATTSLRIRERDVLTPEELVRANPQYKNRYLFGPSWRADIITAIEMGIKNPNQIAKLIGCSYEPANRVFHEYTVANIRVSRV